jgi:hypothetical protein
MSTNVKSNWFLVAFVFLLVMSFFMAGITSCNNEGATSFSGAKQVSIKVPINPDGLTAEQENIGKRIALEGPGALKHLYVISAMSGQVLIYSTVVGKVTSSGKRLSPSEIYDVPGTAGLPVVVKINGSDKTRYTQEMIGDDGTYGSSVPYVYWFDSKGSYHQHYITGGQIFHLSDQPLPVKDIILNMELTNPPTQPPSGADR